MVLVALFWGWALLVSLGLGLGLARTLRGLFGPLPALLTASPELLILSGLAVLSWLVAVLSFGWPVAAPMQVSLSATAMGALVACRAELSKLLRNYGRSWRAAGAGAGLLAAALALLVLVHAAQPPVFPDAALYHAQFVQWLHHYSVVPGLGNLHGRLAFNSHAHLLVAFFSPAAPPAGWPAFQQTVNSLGCLLLVLHHVRRASVHWRRGKQAWLAWYYLSSLALALLVLRPWISSPLPDSTVAVLGLLLMGVLLEQPRLPASGLAWLMLLAATAVTWKPSAAPLLLWPVAWALRQPARHRGRRLGQLAAIALLVLLPWVGRNVVLSGYVAYPLVGSAGSVVAGWAVPPARLAADLAEIRLFARRPTDDWQLAARQSTSQWLPYWWHQQYRADQLLLALALLGVALVAGRVAWRAPARWWRRHDYQLYALLVLGGIFWFLAAPAFRFAYTFLIGAAVLAPLLALEGWLVRWGQVGRWVLGGLLLLYGLNGLRHELGKPGALTTRLIWPADYPAVAAPVAGHLGPYALRLGPPPNGRCGNCPIPCTDSLFAGLQLRGATLRQGFRTVSPAAAASLPDGAKPHSATTNSLQRSLTPSADRSTQAR